MTRIARTGLVWALLAMLALPAVVQAQFNYSNNGDGTCTITGYTGTGGDVSIPNTIDGLTVTGIQDGDWGRPSIFSSCTSITIPCNVIRIGNWVFNNCTSLTNIAIGANVSSIGDYAFYNCTALTSVVMPASIIYIGDSAFSHCTALTSVPIPSNIFFIGYQAFESCTSLASVTIPASVTSIGSIENEAFADCSNLTSIYFKGSVPESPVIGARVFNQDTNAIVYYFRGRTGWGSTFCGLPTVMLTLSNLYTYTTNQDQTITITGYAGFGGDVVIPDTTNNLRIASIESWAFCDCANVTSITIPDSVTNIGNYAFFECSSLTNVTISGSVPNIGDSAFVDCTNLTSVMIPNSVTNIGDLAFMDCTNLTSVTIPNSVISIGDYAFVACFSLSNATIGTNVTNIGDHAFAGCFTLTSVTIPNSVTSIGDYAFSDCTALTNLFFQGNSPNLGADVFNWIFYDPTTVYYLPNSTGWGATYGGLPTVPMGYAYANNGDGTCSVTEYTGPGGDVSIPGVIDGMTVASIGNNAFNGCASLTNITIPNSVTNIGDGAFQNCASLASVAIPSNVTSIGTEAFDGCSYLTNIYFQGNAPRLGSYVFGNDPNGSPYDLATVYYLPGATGWSTTLDGLPTELLLSLSQYTGTGNLDGTINITGYTGPSGNVSIPSTIDGVTVTSIGDDAFNGCTNLTSVAIPSSVTNIGNGAFQNCLNLTTVIIGNGTTTIGKYAFSGCTSLVCLYCNGNAPSLDSDVFYGDTPATVYYLPGTTGWGSTYGGLPTELQPYTYSDNGDGTCTITRYTGSNTTVAIPSTIAGLMVTGITGSAWRQNIFFGCTSVTIPNSVTNIGSYAFASCSSLTAVTIPNNVTSIGDFAFACCGNLTSIYFQGNAPSLGSDVFDYTPAVGCYLSDATGWNSLYGEIPLVAYTINSDNTITIATAQTGSSGAIALPDKIGGLSVTSIGAGACSNCASLTSVTIPSSVTNIGDNAFNGDISLISVTLPFSVYSNLDASVFSGDSPTYSFWYVSGTDTYVYTPNLDGVSCAITGYSGTNTFLAIPGMINGLIVTGIGVNAFSGCATLTNVVISSSVATIGDSAFSGCSGLTGITLPVNITNIGDHSFFCCSSLVNITIPHNVISLGECAFDGCSSLTSIYCQSNAPSLLGFDVFGGLFDCWGDPVDPATVYYLPGTTGWDSTYGGLPTALWNPQIQYDAAFGVQANQFGFDFNWASGMTVVIEACTNLTNPVWVPVATNTLITGSSYFSDPQWTNYPTRYYRLVSP